MDFRCSFSFKKSFKPNYPYLVSHRLKRLPPMPETQVWSLGWGDPLEKEMATHSSIPAWRIPWLEEPGRLQSTAQRVGHDWATSLTHILTLYFWICDTESYKVNSLLWFKAGIEIRNLSLVSQRNARKPFFKRIMSILFKHCNIQKNKTFQFFLWSKQNSAINIEDTFTT